MRKIEDATIRLDRIAVLPWPQRPGCYIVLSGKKAREWREGPNWHNAKTRDERTLFSAYEYRSTPCITFTYQQDGVAAEWDGDHGPIQLWFRYDGDPTENSDARQYDGKWHIDQDGGRTEIVFRHWLWPFATGLGHWSQMAVEREGLPQAFVAGSYDEIFSTLQQWVRSRLAEAA